MHHCSISQSYLQIPIFQEVERNEMHLQVNQSTYPFYHSTSFVNHYLGNLNKNKGSSQARCLIWNVNHNYEKLPLHKTNDLFPLRTTFNNFEKLIFFFFCFNLEKLLCQRAALHAIRIVKAPRHLLQSALLLQELLCL